jgi:hypothetical protein
MKTLVFLFLAATLNYSSPKEIPMGEKFKKIERMFSDYHFKFYKEVTTKSEAYPSPPMCFAMLGYWNKTEGYVLVFSDDVLVLTVIFTNLNDYKEYITNTNEEKNITIKSKNLIL